MPNDSTWFTMGFASNTTSSPFNTGSGPSPWFLIRGNGQYQVFAGPGTSNTLVGSGTGLGTGGGTLSETLDPATDTLSAAFNGTPFYTTTLASLPSINDVFFGQYVDNGVTASRTISRFSLVAAPEPSQAAALGMGIFCLAGLAFTARRRHLSA